jgi:vacuolar-type H+-ATPase subunit I/STV1
MMHLYGSLGVEMKKLMVSLSIFLCSLGFAAAEERYEEETTILSEMSDAMENFTIAMQEFETKEDVITAVETLTERLRELVPRIEAVEEEYPDWGENPPEEVAPYMERFLLVSEQFATEGIQILVEYVTDKQEDEELMAALMAFNGVMEGGDEQ